LKKKNLTPYPKLGHRFEKLKIVNPQSNGHVF
jgi:hypothetical protein